MRWEGSKILVEISRASALTWTDPELRQIDEDFLRDLKEKNPEALVDLSLKLATDLKETRERLNQTSSNSSKPSGSFPLWDKGGTTYDDLNDDEDLELKKGPA